MKSMATTMKKCRHCGWILADENKCDSCGSSELSTVMCVECVPVDGEHHFRLDRELVMVLNNFAGKACRVMIEEV